MSAAADRPRVLICDDEQQILRALRVILRDAGFEPLPASTAEEALDVAAVRRPDAAIVDLLLPDGDGIELCRRLREWSEMPVIVLSAVGEEDAKVKALAAGADDYVTKPFGPRELVARLEANLRRSAGEQEESVIASDGLSIDLARRTVTRDGEEVHLTPTEFELLRQLARNRGRLMTHRELLLSVWGSGYGDDTQVLRAHIANLRRKIEPAGRAPGDPHRVGRRLPVRPCSCVVAQGAAPSAAPQMCHSRSISNGASVVSMFSLKCFDRRCSSKASSES